MLIRGKNSTLANLALNVAFTDYSYHFNRLPLNKIEHMGCLERPGQVPFSFLCFQPVAIQLISEIRLHGRDSNLFPSWEVGSKPLDSQSSTTPKPDSCNLLEAKWCIIQLVICLMLSHWYQQETLNLAQWFPNLVVLDGNSQKPPPAELMVKASENCSPKHLG